MRVKSAHALPIAVLVVSLSGSGPTLAQFFDVPQVNRTPETVQPQPARPLPSAPQPAPTLSLRRLFGMDEDEQAPSGTGATADLPGAGGRIGQCTAAAHPADP
jgi:hypothetical protein